MQKRAWVMLRRVAVVVVALGVFGWVGYSWLGWPPEPPQELRAALSGDEPTDAASETAAPETTTVALVRGSVQEGTWWEPVVLEGAPEGVEGGQLVELTPSSPLPGGIDLERLAEADVVVVQAGQREIRNGTPAVYVQDRLQAILSRLLSLQGPQVVWATVPPLSTNAAAVVSLNDGMASWAEQRGVTVWDVTSPVADGGAWRDGLSDDGIAPTPKGQRAIEQAVTPLVEGLAGT